MYTEKKKAEHGSTAFLRVSVLLLALLCIALFLLTRGTIAAGVQNGLALCGKVILPAVFPFMFLCKLMVKIRVAEALPRGVRRMLSRMFRVSGDGGAIIFLSLFAGYPVCTYLCGELCRTGSLKREEAARMIAYVNNATPAFLIGLGGSVLGDIRKGIVLYLTVISTALFYGFLSGRRAPRVSPVEALPEYALSFDDFIRHFCAAMTESAAAIITVCAYIILFSAFSACIAAACIALSLPASVSAVLALLCELTGGFSVVGGAFHGALLFALLAAFAAFSGICVHLQVISAASADGIGTGRFIRGKLVQGILTFFLSYFIYLGFF